jgi:hypothetical protein
MRKYEQDTENRGVGSFHGRIIAQPAGSNPDLPSGHLSYSLIFDFLVLDLSPFFAQRLTYLCRQPTTSPPSRTPTAPPSSAPKLQALR